MAAPHQQRLQVQRRFNKQRTDTLWPVNFMAANRNQIRIELINAFEREFTQPLDSIGVEHNPALAAHIPNFGNRLDGPNLIIGGHYRNREGIGTNRWLERVNRHQAFVINWQIADSEPLLLRKRLTGV